MRVGIFFFFQAEDGIRDLTVTGVQTCALPICPAQVRLVSGPPPARGVGGERSNAHRRRRDSVGVSAPERAIAVDSAAVLAITSDAIARYSGSAPVSATVQVLKDLPLRLVARYDLALADGTTALVVAGDKAERQDLQHLHRGADRR